jgi:hypothetical protein
LSPVHTMDSLKHGQFSEVLSEEEWKAFKPELFEIIGKHGKFTLLVQLGCGCVLPIFYESTVAKMEDGSKQEILVSRVAQPKDWDAACPFRSVPESATRVPQLTIPLFSWGHGSVKFALQRLEELDGGS